MDSRCSSVLSMSNDDISYYKSYYDNMGDAAYLGEKLKTSSRMLVFQDWLRGYLKPGAKVLDIGCGDAIFAELMPEFEWYGVDINIDAAGKSDRAIGLVAHDLMKPPYPWESGTFDAIICSEVLEHLWDLRTVHKEAKRLLKRDGVYVISTPNFNWLQNVLEHHQRILSNFEQQWTIEHVRHYTFETHQKFLNDIGFVVDKHVGADSHYDPVTANICRVIRDKLREQGVEVQEERLHQWTGEAIPSLSHTVIVSARKAWPNKN